MSSFTAFLVNFSFFLSSSVTSSLTVNVVGYVKTCIVFIGGFYLFNADLDAKNVFGILLTLIGVLGYTYVKIYPAQPESRAVKSEPLKLEDIVEKKTQEV